MATNGAPRTIACPSCGAPVALSIVADRQTCPSCRTQVVLPVEVRAELYATQKLLGSKLELARSLDVASGKVLASERAALVFAVGLVLLLCGGLHGLMLFANLAHFDRAGLRGIVPPGAAFITVFAVAFALVGAHRLAQRSLKKTFTARAPEPGAPHGACHACGGPLAPSNGAPVRCEHCGCENLVGSTLVVRRAVDLAADLSSHADDMLRATRRVRTWTQVLGYAGLVLIPLVSVAVWLLFDWLLRLLVDS
jgi:DNA-directed RNA polymerase subunit RPC12/RpoP